MSAYNPHTNNELRNQSEGNVSRQDIYTPMTPAACYLGPRTPNSRNIQTSNSPVQQHRHVNSSPNPFILPGTESATKQQRDHAGYAKRPPTAIRPPVNGSPYISARHEEERREHTNKAPMLSEVHHAMTASQPPAKRLLSETIASWKRNKDLKDAAERSARGGPSLPRNPVNPADLVQRANPDPSLKDHKFFKNILNF